MYAGAPFRAVASRHVTNVFSHGLLRLRPGPRDDPCEQDPERLAESCGNPDQSVATAVLVSQLSLPVAWHQADASCGFIVARLKNSSNSGDEGMCPMDNLARLSIASIAAE
jgi:hypothetical protein